MHGWLQKSSEQKLWLVWFGWCNETPAAAREEWEGIWAGIVVFNSSASAREVTWAAKGVGSAAFVTSAQFLLEPREHKPPVKPEIPTFSCALCVAAALSEARPCNPQQSVFLQPISPCPRALQAAQGC